MRVGCSQQIGGFIGSPNGLLFGAGRLLGGQHIVQIFLLFGRHDDRSSTSKVVTRRAVHAMLVSFMLCVRMQSCTHDEEENCLEGAHREAASIILGLSSARYETVNVVGFC